MASILLSRLISEKALKLLSDEQKIKLIEAFSHTRKYNMLPLIILFTAYILAMKLFPLYQLSIISATLTLFIFFFVVRGKFVLKKLNDLNFPDQYIKKIKLAKWISYLGLILFCGWMVFIFLT